MSATVLCIGECMAEVSTVGGGCRLGFGGDTLNACVQLARLLGAGRVGYVTRLGDDPYSIRMRAAWAEEGIDCSRVECVPGRTVGLYAIDNDAAGERTFTYWRGESPARELLAGDNADALVESIATAELVYFSGVTLAVLGDSGRERLLAAAARARASGAWVTVDPNLRPRLWPLRDAAPWLERAYGVASVVLSSVDEERQLDAGAPAEVSAEWPWARVAALGCDELVLRDGANGAYLLDEGEPLRVPSPVPARVLDTTGAGDGFNAAYMAARVGGATRQDAARAACAFGSRVVAHAGAILPRDRAGMSPGESSPAGF